MVLYYIYKLTLWNTILLVFSFFCYAIYIASINIIHFRRFERKLKGVPIVPGDYIFGSQFHRYITAKHNPWNIAADHKKYGKSFAYMFARVPTVATTDLRLIKKVVIEEGNIHTDHVAPDGFPSTDYSIDNWLLVPGDQWRRMRRAFAPAFTSFKFKAPNVHRDLERSGELLDQGLAWRLEGRDEVIVDGEDIFQRYFLELVFRILMKQPDTIDFLAKQDVWTDIFERGAKMLRSRFIVSCLVFPVVAPLVESFSTYLSPLGTLVIKLREFTEKGLKDSLEARKLLEKSGQSINLVDEVQLADGSTYRRGLLDHAISKLQEGRISYTEYSHTAIMLFFAVAKESADGLSKFFYLLAKHTEIQEKLRQSILLDGIDSEYLSWCINEALRLFPPAIGGASRKTAADVTVDEIYIPAGCYVISSAMVIHRMKEYWGDDADEYKPERWSQAKNFHPAQYLPFGGGKRSCPGKDLALHSIKLLTDRLLRKYRFEYLPESNDEARFSAPYLIFCNADGPTNIRVTRV